MRGSEPCSRFLPILGLWVLSWGATIGVHLWAYQRGADLALALFGGIFALGLVGSLLLWGAYTGADQVHPSRQGCFSESPNITEASEPDWAHWPVAVAIVDPHGRIERANAAARALKAGARHVQDWGLEDEQGRPLAGWISIGSASQSSIVGGMVFRRTADAQDRRWVAFLAPHARAGRWYLILAPTPQASASTALDTSEEGLQQRFLSLLSHEIRTPANVLVGYAEMLKREWGEPQNLFIREALEAIAQNSLRLVHTIESLLEIARLEAGEWRPSPRPVYADALLERLAGRYASLAQAKGLRWSLQLEAGPLPVRSDPDACRKVMESILENAIKFTERGGIAVRTRRRGANWELSVQDTGIGIAPQVLQRLGEPFRQGHEGLSRPYEGLGLGLALAHRLVRLTGGELEIRSQSGVGTTVWVRWPLLTPRPIPEGVCLRGCRVLLYDPDPRRPGWLAALLERVQAEVLRVQTLEAFWEALGRGGFDVCVVNLAPMEQGSWERFLERIQTLRALPLVAVAPLRGEADRRTLWGLGCSGAIDISQSGIELGREVMSCWLAAS
ncbi:MAG: HAMP domain-containing sensor histidine kinase [Bacteroidota bacterium]|nr:HAMP domain-containing histidine kinase [Bacteroidota bacterium]MDW8136995.1 HAMP domain-containing sensor histidine kinase [Bacteroidota bacterium]